MDALCYLMSDSSSRGSRNGYDISSKKKDTERSHKFKNGGSGERRKARRLESAGDVLVVSQRRFKKECLCTVTVVWIERH